MRIYTDKILLDEDGDQYVEIDADDVLDEIDNSTVESYARRYLDMDLLEDLFDSDLVSELEDRSYNFMQEVDEDDMIDYLEENGYIVTSDDEKSIGVLDNIAEIQLEEIKNKFISGSWQEKEEIYSLIKRL